MTGDTSPIVGAGRRWPWLAAGLAAVVLTGTWAYIHTADRPLAVEVPRKPRLSLEDLERLDGERRHLVSELERKPAISPDGLASPEAIAENADRFDALVSVLERMDGQSRHAEGAPAPSRELAASLREKSRTERNLYTRSRELLAFLRASWGKWKFVEGPGLQVRFASEEGQRHLQELADGVQNAQLDMNRIDDTLRALAPIGR